MKEAAQHLTEGQAAMAKAGTAWGGTGIAFYLERLGFSSWGDVAAFLAAVYSLILIGEWCWKKWKGRHGKNY